MRMCAGRVTSLPMAHASETGTDIKEARILCAGAGSSGLGVCQQILDGMVESGLPRDEAKRRWGFLCSFSEPI